MIEEQDEEMDWSKVSDEDLDDIYWIADMLRPEAADQMFDEYERRKRPYPEPEKAAP